MGLLGLFNKKSKADDVQSSAPDISDLPPIPEPVDSFSSEPLADAPLESYDNLPPVDNSSESLPDDQSLPLEDVSSEDLSDDLSSLEASPPDIAPIEEPSSGDFSESSDSSISSQPEDLTSSSYDVQSPAKDSLPTFEEAKLSAPVDIQSLSISELFVKKERYVEVLETLHTTKKELDLLVKKSELVKPNEKISSLLTKAATKHADLNKGLMFVEEKLVE